METYDIVWVGRCWEDMIFVFPANLYLQITINITVNSDLMANELISNSIMYYLYGCSKVYPDSDILLFLDHNKSMKKLR